MVFRVSQPRDIMNDMSSDESDLIFDPTLSNQSEDVLSCIEVRKARQSIAKPGPASSNGKSQRGVNCDIWFYVSP